ncbi:response regulator transcription factor [Clostridium luticellarii]|jgi:DNA-binding response OmpR family regulator|uniref:Stage 0 sporulation protein A homolog n=1 Tax=Clostridium luticellarii TaxID=1691940 RepID=A0A2T0BNQ7_9CLOT|nr:response regulator transcription factor [Clostridium luticellarii]MCI1944417.1 response regulator transcription factor [Clostridium luticellarii]MCI1969145.1 response regulator transcription factor [Clostridium luticellarii]PRR85500.1 Transcriptional regulatory protein SrrA [Clostridium luticellarii]
MDKNLVLIVDDDESIRELLGIMLRNQNMDTVCAANGMEALHILENTKIDLILMDIMMPKMDGMVACMKIREKLNMPIIMISAKVEDSDKIMGLTIGADDYIAKPFNPMIVMAKVKAQLRRYKEFNSSQVEFDSRSIKIQGMLMDLDRHQVLVDGRKVELTPHEFAILAFLSKNKDRVLSIKQIYENVWEKPYIEFDRTVTVHIRRLRQKIGSDYIKTVWGVGYKIES